MVPTASGLDIKIPKGAGACEGLTHPAGQCRDNHHLGTQKSLLRAAAAALHAQASQHLLSARAGICHSPSSPLLESTSPGAHPKLDKQEPFARWQLRKPHFPRRYGSFLWQGAEDRIQYSRPTACARDLEERSERLTRALTAIGPLTEEKQQQGQWTEESTTTGLRHNSWSAQVIVQWSKYVRTNLL